MGVVGWCDGPGLTSSAGASYNLDYSRARAYCACSRCGWGCLDIFSLVYHFSFLTPSLWETARHRLKYCLKGPLSPNQPTNQPTNLLHTRICRYTCIYITPTVQTLHYCPAGEWRRNDVVLTSMWHHHVALTSCACWVCPRQVCKKLSYLENEIYRVQSGVLPTKFGHTLLLSISAQPDYMWKNWKKK